MDKVKPDLTTPPVDAPTRRQQRRSQVVQRQGSALEASEGGYQTPVWLERSFVLPTQASPTARRTEMPHQLRPGHDDLTAPPQSPTSVPAAATARPGDESIGARLARSGAVRPGSDDVDFRRLLRRNDARLAARRTTVVALIVALAAGALLGVSVTFAGVTLLVTALVVTLVAAVSTLVLGRTPAPHLRG